MPRPYLLINCPLSHIILRSFLKNTEKNTLLRNFGENMMKTSILYYLKNKYHHNITNLPKTLKITQAKRSEAVAADIHEY